MGFHEAVFNFIWYTVEFITDLCVIAYVAYTFKLIGPWKTKKDVPGTFDDTWSQTSSILTAAATVANKINSATADSSAAVAETAKVAAKAAAKK